MNSENNNLDEEKIKTPEIIGTLIGDTGKFSLTIALKDSFGARRGEFVRVLHKEYKENMTLEQALSMVIKALSKAGLGLLDKKKPCDYAKENFRR